MCTVTNKIIFTPGFDGCRNEHYDSYCLGRVAKKCFICRVILYITVKVKTYILLLYTSLEILRLLKQKFNTQDCAQFLTIFRAKMLNTYSWASRKCEKKSIGVYRVICHLGYVSL